MSDSEDWENNDKVEEENNDASEWQVPEVKTLEIVKETLLKDDDNDDNDDDEEEEEQDTTTGTGETTNNNGSSSATSGGTTTVTGKPKKKTRNALSDFSIKHMTDVDRLVNEIVKSKLFPQTEERMKKLSAKSAHWKCLKQAVEANYAQMETKEMEKFDRELQKMIDFKKKVEAQLLLEEKRDLLQAEEEEKKKREEALKKEAEAKGETYINDEDFFAGLE